MDRRKRMRKPGPNDNLAMSFTREKDQINENPGNNLLRIGLYFRPLCC